MSKQQPTHPKVNTGTDPLSEFSLYALLFTWYEADIIEANVRNLFAQGVERVFIIDNDSPDDTREVAEAAGAEVISIYRSNNFIEGMKVKKVNDLTRKIVDEAPHDNVWILHVDADELVTGPSGLTVRQYLETLDSEFRVVGSLWINHQPLMAIKNIPGFHPMEFQLNARYHGGEGVCVLAHNKHQLLRYDKGGIEIRAGAGYHWYDSPILQAEPNDTLWTHHFNFREFKITERRLRVLMENRMTQRDAFAKRRTNSDEAECFWTSRYKKLRSTYEAEPCNTTWPNLVPTVDIPKWYSEEELLQAVQGRLGSQASWQFMAERAFVLGDSKLALNYISEYSFDGGNLAAEEALKVKKLQCLISVGQGAEAHALMFSILQDSPSIEVIKQIKSIQCQPQS